MPCLSSLLIAPSYFLFILSVWKKNILLSLFFNKRHSLSHPVIHFTLLLFNGLGLSPALLFTNIRGNKPFLSPPIIPMVSRYYFALCSFELWQIITTLCCLLLYLHGSLCDDGERVVRKRSPASSSPSHPPSMALGAEVFGGGE